jgi:hypothetical protein
MTDNHLVNTGLSIDSSLWHGEIKKDDLVSGFPVMVQWYTREIEIEGNWKTIMKNRNLQEF